MFKRTAPTEHPVNHPSAPAPGQGQLPTPPTSGSATPNPFGASLLNAVASSATAGPTPSPTPPASGAPLTLITSSSNFDSILSQSPAVVVNFTNTPSCPPCRVIKPVYETIASDYTLQYGSKGARFLEVELGMGEGRDIASRFGVSATPTFIFFKNGKKADELRGASKKELEVKVEGFMEDVWPRHPHRKVYLRQLEGLPTTPITSSATPNYGALVGKIESFGVSGTDLQTIKNKVVALLEAKSTSDNELRTAYSAWMEVSTKLISALQPEQTFPLIDLWRVGLLNPRLAALVALQLNSNSPNPITPILALAQTVLHERGTSTPKPFLLTTLRLLTNLLASLPIANLLLLHSTDTLIGIVVESLLHADNSVRSAAAGVAYNLAAVRHRDARERGVGAEDGEEKDWEVELVSALVEGIGREEDEDVGESQLSKLSQALLLTPAHRLLASLGLAVLLAPGYETSLRPLLEVLGAKETIGEKIKVFKKKEVKKLGEELVTVC